MDQTFDTIIVGAGSAGCVLANRLSADRSRRVLLLEAGGWDRSPLISLPMAAPLMTQRNLYDWADVSEPDPELGGRPQIIPHGKVIGGTSSINYMAHTRGHPHDYARWVAAGAKGWSFEENLPFFKSIETWERGEDAWRGGHGELGARAPTSDDPIFPAWRQAAARLGYRLTEDFNGEHPEGVGLNQYTVKNGRRASSARAFLRPALKRPNLTVRTGALATRLLRDGQKIVGVEYVRDGRREVARSAERTVLCLGAINTPHLLMLSGIGPADHLRAMGIKPVVDLPVGQHLEDHLGFAMTWSRQGPPSEFGRLMRLDRIGMAMLAAYFLGRGPATTLPAVFLAYVKSEPGLPQPDLELLLQLPGASSYWFPGLTAPFRDGFGVKAYLTGQESLGEVRLRSAEPNERPLIRYNSLSAPGDLPKLRAAYKRLWELVHASELAPFRGKLVYPKTAPQDDAEIDAFLRSSASQQFHPASTCRMGDGPDAVLNPDLSVRGVDGLYVVDASAMPRLVSGNPNVVIMMMAAKAASLWTGGPAK